MKILPVRHTLSIQGRKFTHSMYLDDNMVFRIVDNITETVDIDI